MAPSSSSSAVEEFVRKEVPNWDDEVASTARFKVFSGQRSDWEPRYVFWRDLILKVARHLGVCVVQASEVKNIWFARGVLKPLCIDRVLLEMYKNGDILLRRDLIDPSSGRLYQIIRRVEQFISVTKSSALPENSEDHLVLRTLLQEKAHSIVELLTQNYWTSSCVITMAKFQSMCKPSDETSAILSHLVECEKAQYLSIRKKELVEGVKVSLVSTSAPSISSLDYDTLHLIWTTEQLQQQLDVIDQRWEGSRKLAILSLKSGNKQAAYRYIRQSKLFSDSRGKCAFLLDRMEEVIGVIANAESTKKVSEAIQIGARAIKENKISVDEIHLSLQELEEFVAYQKQISETLESVPLHSVVIEDEDIEEEFKRLELEEEHNKLERELGDGSSDVQLVVPAKNGALKETTFEVSTKQLSENLSKLNLEPA